MQYPAKHKGRISGQFDIRSILNFDIKFLSHACCRRRKVDQRQVNMRQITAAIDKAVGDTLSELGDSMIQFVVEETQKAMKDVASKAKDAAAAKNAEAANTEEVRSTINFDRAAVEHNKAIIIKASIPMIEESEEETTTTAATTPTTKSSDQELETSTPEEDMLDTFTTEAPAADVDVATAMADRTTRKIDSSAVKFNTNSDDDDEVDYLDFAMSYAPLDFGILPNTEQASQAAPDTDDSYECEHYNVCKLNETLYPDREIR